MPVVLHMLVVDLIQCVLQSRQFFIGASISLGIKDIPDGIPDVDKGKHPLFQFRGFSQDSVYLLTPSCGQIFFSPNFPRDFLIFLLAYDGIPYQLLMKIELEIMGCTINIMVDHLAILIGIAVTVAGLYVFLHWRFQGFLGFFIAALKVCDGLGDFLAQIHASFRLTGNHITMRSRGQSQLPQYIFRVLVKISVNGLVFKLLR